MRQFITHALEPVALLIYFCALLFWSWKDKRKIIKVLCLFYLILSLLIFKALTIKAGIGDSNILFYSLACVLTSLAISAYFYNIFNKRWGRVIVLFSIAVNVGYYLIHNIIKQAPNIFDSLAYVILSSSIVVFVFIYMHQLLNEIKEEPLSLSFDFWFVSSQLFYFLGAFAIFLTYGYLTKQVLNNNIKISATLTWLWGFHNVLLFLSSLITTGSIIWISYHNKSHSS